MNISLQNEPPHRLGPLETKAGRLQAWALGHGPANIILWSGLFFDHRQHLPLARLLVAQGHSVLLVDPPGFGGSTAEPGLTMEQCGAAFLQVAQELGSERPTLGGTSWGGIAALHAALQEPEQIGGLLLFNTPLGPGSSRGAMGWIPTLTALPAPLFAMGASPSLFGPRRRKELRGSVAESVRGVPRHVLRSTTKAVLHERSDLVLRLADLELPALVALGPEDSLYDASALRNAWRSAAQAHVVEIPETGHSSALEAPTQVATQVQQFLSTHNASGSGHDD